MKILAVDSSGQVASVAIVTEDTVLAEYSVDFKKTHSQTLLPMIDAVLTMTETEGTELDAIAVAAGPGSFTGLRIGASTVKGLAMIWDKPIIAIPTVDGLAANLAGTDRLVCPLMDARRSQVYTGLYRFVDNSLVPIREQGCMMLDEILAEIQKESHGREVVFLGDGVAVSQARIEEVLDLPHTYAPFHLNKQKASSLGYLAVQYLRMGKTTTAMDFVPDYCRLSQAERELEEKTKQ